MYKKYLSKSDWDRMLRSYDRSVRPEVKNEAVRLNVHQARKSLEKLRGRTIRSRTVWYGLDQIQIHL
jgi:hypothetical protein